MAHMIIFGAEEVSTSFLYSLKENNNNVEFQSVFCIQRNRRTEKTPHRHYQPLPPEQIRKFQDPAAEKSNRTSKFGSQKQLQCGAPPAMFVN
jgi:hypothetical protein